MNRLLKWMTIFPLLCLLTPLRSQPVQPPFVFKGDNNYPPYEFSDEDGNPAGFNVEILQAVCRVMNIPIKLEMDAWNRVRSDLEAGTIDGITGMFYSRSRSEQVAFSVPFIIVSHSIFVRKDSKIHDLEDVRNKKILVQEGDIMHDFVLNSALSPDVFPVENQKDALRRLATGEFDCAILAKLLGLYHIHQLELTNLKAVGPSIQPKKYCIAVRKGNDVLIAQINEGLGIIQQTGTYKEIYEKWFGIYEPRTGLEILKYFVGGIVFVLFLLIAGFVVYVSLKTQVSRQTEALNREIKERIEIEKALRASEGKFRSLFQNSNDAIYLLYHGKFEIINEKFEKMFQISLKEVQQEDFNFMKLVAGKSKSFILERQEKLERGENIPLKYEFTGRSTDGSEIELEASVSYIQYQEGFATQGVLRDITLRKKLEMQLQQAQKLDAIGTLAGGIAHDFNNLLTVVIGRAEVILMQLEAWNPIFDEVIAIKAAGERAEDLTRKLLAFSRKQIHRPRIIDLNHTILEIERILRRLITEDIHLNLQLNPQIPNIKADPGQIEQILINLVVNARDAMNQKIFENGEKEIIIKTDFAYPDDLLFPKVTNPKATSVMFSVGDNGTGINSVTKAKIFEPFFTTKPVGKGTGLGLATVYGIVQQNTAVIDVESEVGRGSVFKIFWPATSDAPEERAERLEEVIQGGTASILLVEDDENIRDFTVSALKKLGYLVFEAANGKAALEMLQNTPMKIDLLISDLVMPFMNGHELARIISELIPDISVLFISGYADDQIIQSGILDADDNFLQKPYSLHVLASRIHEILQQKEKSRSIKI